MTRRPRPEPSVAPPATLVQRWCALGLEPGVCTTPVTVQRDGAGTYHLDPGCPERAPRWRRSAPISIPLDELATSGCAACATPEQLAEHVLLAGGSVASWLAQADQLAERLTQLEATTTPARIAALVPRLSRDAAWLARHPEIAGRLAVATSHAVADALVRREVLVDRALLERWASRHQLRRTYLYAPLPSGALASRLGGFDAVEDELSRWALSHPDAPSFPEWEAVHAHWTNLAEHMELGPLELCCVASTGDAEPFERDELGGTLSTPAVRHRRELLTAWLCPHPSVRLVPRAVGDLFAELAAAEGWELARQPCTDPLAVPVALDALRAGISAGPALRLATAADPRTNAVRP